MNKIYNMPLFLLRFHEEGGSGDGDAELSGVPDDVKNHPYFKRLATENANLRVKHKEASGKLTEIELKEKEAEKARLKEENKHKELAETLQKDLERIKSSHEEQLSIRDARVIGAEIKIQARELGVKKEAMSKLISLLDTEGIEIGDDGDVVGVTEALEKLKTDMPFLFDTSSENDSGGSGDGDGSEEPVKRPARPARARDTKGNLVDFRDPKVPKSSLDKAWAALAK